MNKVGAALLLVLSGLLVACSGGGGSATPTTTLPPTVVIKGNVAISGPRNVRGNLSDCVGVGPYADLRTGAPVTVTTPAGKPLGIGKIILGVGTNVYQDQLDQCTFRYIVLSVKTRRNYIVKVAQQRPLPVALTYLIATRGNFDINLTPTTTTTFPTNPLAPKVTTPPQTIR